MDEQHEISTNRVPVTAKLEPAILAAIERLAKNEDRSVSNMIERLLKMSPQVQSELAGVAAI